MLNCVYFGRILKLSKNWGKNISAGLLKNLCMVVAKQLA